MNQLVLQVCHMYEELFFVFCFALTKILTSDKPSSYHETTSIQMDFDMKSDVKISIITGLFSIYIFIYIMYILHVIFASIGSSIPTYKEYE